MNKFTLDTTVGALLDDPQAKAVIEKNFPGMSANPMISMVRGMSLNAVLAMPQAAQFGLTKDKAQAMLDQLNAQVK